MKKNTKAENIWGDDLDPNTLTPKQETVTVPTLMGTVQYEKPITPTNKSVDPQFDIDGLMTDFPTATELERFVYDQTGIVLNLKGRANKLKYQVAMDVLNGVEVDPIFTGSDNQIGRAHV